LQPSHMLRRSRVREEAAALPKVHGLP
jgi:hypothetical protein